jgi:hypothetical protein
MNAGKRRFLSNKQLFKETDYGKRKKTRERTERRH